MSVCTEGKGRGRVSWIPNGAQQCLAQKAVEKKKTRIDSHLIQVPYFKQKTNKKQTERSNNLNLLKTTRPPPPPAPIM